MDFTIGIYFEIVLFEIIFLLLFEMVLKTLASTPQSCHIISVK